MPFLLPSLTNNCMMVVISWSRHVTSYVRATLWMVGGGISLLVWLQLVAWLSSLLIWKINQASRSTWRVRCALVGCLTDYPVMHASRIRAPLILRDFQSPLSTLFGDHVNGGLRCKPVDRRYFCAGWRHTTRSITHTHILRPSLNKSILTPELSWCGHVIDWSILALVRVEYNTWSCSILIPAPKNGSMLGQRRKRWVNIETTLGGCRTRWANLGPTLGEWLVFALNWYWNGEYNMFSLRGLYIAL